MPSEFPKPRTLRRVAARDLSNQEVPNIARPLLRWYRRHKRDLPWRRRERDAYAQLVAEVMLQQTQVTTVIPYYERFLERFPTVTALADAPIDDVLALWAGLGYYSRARNLHAAARRIVEEYQGKVPGTVEGLMALPGIGRYTAGAIASIAFGMRAPVLDGNVARVLCRLIGLAGDPKAPQTRSALWTLAKALLPVRRCGDFNQALMELGATVCSPQGPECPTCPLKAICLAHHEGTTDRIPPAAKRAKVREALMIVAAVRRGRKLLFVQRPTIGLWAGLWELPAEPVREGESNRSARARLKRSLPPGTSVARQPVGEVTRQLTHRRITFRVYPALMSDPRTRPAAATARDPSGQWRSPVPYRWSTAADAPRLGISRACEAVLRLLDAGGGGRASCPPSE